MSLMVDTMTLAAAKDWSGLMTCIETDANLDNDDDCLAILPAIKTLIVAGESETPRAVKILAALRPHLTRTGHIR